MVSDFTSFVIIRIEYSLKDYGTTAWKLEKLFIDSMKCWVSFNPVRRHALAISIKIKTYKIVLRPYRWDQFT